MAFLSRPVVELGKEFLKFKNCNASHQNDVLTLDINSDNQLVTASLDNTVSFWDSFSAQESKTIPLPESIAPCISGRTVQYVRYPFKDKRLRNFLLVIMNRGQCYIIETQTEKWLKYYKDEQLKKELDESDECSCKDDDSHSDHEDDLNVSGEYRQSVIREEDSRGKEETSMNMDKVKMRKSNIGSNNSPENMRTTNPSRGSHYSSIQNRS